MQLTGPAFCLADALQADIAVGPLALGGTIYVLSMLLAFVRWHVLVRAQRLPFTLGDAIRLGLGGFALSTFLPGSFGGDIVKAACIAREQSRRTVAVATVFIDRVIGLIGLFWLVALLGGYFWLSRSLDGVPDQATTSLSTIIGGAWLLVAASLACWLLLGVLPGDRVETVARWLAGVPKVGTSLAEFWRAVWMYRCRGRSVGLALLMAIVGHVGYILTFYCCSLTLGSSHAVPSLGVHFVVVPVGLTIQAGFPAPGGIGGGEYAFGKLWHLVGFTFASGVLALLVQRIISWVVALFAYTVYLLWTPKTSLTSEMELDRGTLDGSNERERQSTMILGARTNRKSA